MKEKKQEKVKISGEKKGNVKGFYDEQKAKDRYILYHVFNWFHRRDVTQFLT